MVGPPSDVNRIAVLFVTDVWISSGPFIDQSEQEKPGILRPAKSWPVLFHPEHRPGRRHPQQTLPPNTCM